MDDDYRIPDIADLPDEALPPIEELPGDLRLIAEVTGVRKALLVAERIGGSGLYVHSTKKIKKRLRDGIMRRMYDRGGITVRELARLFDVCERQAYYILGVPDPDGRQMRIF